MWHWQICVPLDLTLNNATFQAQSLFGDLFCLRRKDDCFLKHVRFGCVYYALCTSAYSKAIIMSLSEGTHHVMFVKRFTDVCRNVDWSNASSLIRHSCSCFALSYSWFISTRLLQTPTSDLDGNVVYGKLFSLALAVYNRLFECGCCFCAHTTIFMSSSLLLITPQPRALMLYEYRH